MADIFISYSKAFRPLTEALAKDLEARGYNVWWDTSLLSGETFRDVILRELNAARAVIVIWTPASVKSDWVISEATRAKAQGKLITVRSAKVAPGDIPPPFDVLHCDLIDDRERIYAALAKFGVLPPASGAPKAEARPASSRPAPWLWLSAGAVSLAMIAAIYFGMQKAPACTAADWDHVQKTERIGTLRGFASDCKGYRYGDLADEEIARRDKAAWEAAKTANTVEAYQAYLRDWPHGAVAAEATSSAEAIKKAEEARRKAEEKEEKFRLDNAAWSKTEEVNLIEGWQAYLKAWPEGRHAAQARAGIAARDQQEWIIRTFTGHSSFVLSVAISPDGRTALSGSSNHTLKLWDVSTGKELFTFKGHSDNVWSIAISPDGRTALSGSSDHTLKLWDLATGKELRTFTGHSGMVFSVAFSPDGLAALSGGCDMREAGVHNCAAGSLKLWDVANGRELRTFTGHTDLVRSAAISPDGRAALSSSNDGTMKLWDLATSKELRAFTGHTNSVISVAISPDGRTALSGSDDHTLKLWDLATGKELRTFTGHSGSVTSVAFSPDGHTALSGSDDHTLKLWDLATGKELRTFTGHSGSVTSVAFSPDGHTVLSGSLDSTLKLWDLATGKRLRTFTGHAFSVDSVAISPDGRTALSGSSDKTLKLWDLTGIE